MPTDLLSLAFAAAMPLAAFALYAGVRWMADRRVRRLSRPQSAKRARISKSAKPLASTVELVPMATPHVTATAEPTAIATPQPTAAPNPLAGPTPTRRMLAKLPVSRPIGASPMNGASPTSAPWGAPAGTRVGARALAPTHEPSPRLASEPAMPQESAAPLRPIPVSGLADPVPVELPPSGTRTGAELSAQRQRPSRLSSSLNPIRAVLGRRRGNRRPVEPTWPEPDQLDAPFASPLAANGLGPCPFCAESAERGAWFCRRCRRPVDARAITAASALNRPVVQLPIQAIPLAPSVSRTPAGAAPAMPPPSRAALPPGARPTQPDSRPLITRLRVTHPTQYVPAARLAVGGPVKPGRSTPLDPAASADGARPGATRQPAPGPAPASRAVATAGPGPESAAAGPRVVRPEPVVARVPRAGSNGVHLGGSNGSLVAVGPGRPARDHRVDLNRATATQLLALRGVGRVTATKIIAAREEQMFAAVDALVERRIVAQTVLEKLRHQVTV